MMDKNIATGKTPATKINTSNIITYEILNDNPFNIFKDRFIPVDIKILNGHKEARFPKDWTNTYFEKWDTQNSVAIKTGDGYIVLDIDTKDLNYLNKMIRGFVEDRLLLRDTLIIETTNGYHFYFKTTDSYSNSVRVSNFVDIRADGGCAFISSKVQELNYSLYSNAEIAELPDFLKTLMKEKSAIQYEYNESGQKQRTVNRSPNPALFHAVASGDIDRVLKASGMKRENFINGQIYVNFNKFAFILANEPSVHNEYVPNILKLLVEEVLEFEWDSTETNKYVNQSLGNMIWASEYIEPKGIELFLLGDKYIISNEGHIFESLTKQTATTHWIKAGKHISDFLSELTILKEVQHKVDYLNPSKYHEENQILTIINNPTDSWNVDIELDETLIDDYEDKVMNGQLKKLLKIIVWSIRIGENKLNKLLLVGKSNKGKTEFARLMGFVEMAAKDFVNILNSKKKWSKSESKRLLSCGLLLADDIIHDLPLSIKNVSDTITLDIMHRGHTVHPMKFMLMTSTHSSVISTMNDELKNRILVMEIGGNYTLNDSPHYQKNPQKYREQTGAYIKKLILNYLNDSFSNEEFRELQNELRAPNHNERDEILESAKEKVVNEVREGHKLDVLPYKEYYALKRKNDLKKLIRDTLKEEFDDHRIDLTKETVLLMNELISKERTISISQDGQSEKYYEVFIKNTGEDFDPLK